MTGRLEVRGARRGEEPRATRLCVLILCLATATVLSTSAQSQAPRPQFREGVDLGHIDVVALDGDRRPVRGLKASDFTVKIAGRVMPVRTFAAVEIPGAPAVSLPGATWTRNVAPDVQTNLVSDEGRLVVIFFDRSIPPGEKLVTAQKIARAAVNELGPNDVAAITAVRARPVQDLTNDRARLLRAIDEAYSGSASNNDNGVNNDPDEACSCNTCVLDQIRNIAGALRNIQRPKVLLFIGSQLTVGAGDITPGNPMSPDAMRCSPSVTLSRKQMYQALDLANVTIHSVDPSGVQTPAGTSAASSLRGSAVVGAVQEGARLRLAFQGQIRVLPDRTGGRTITNTNAPQAFVPAILSESAAYYVLGFDAPKDLPEHPSVEVTVSRRGVRVHTQHAYESAIQPTGPLTESEASETRTSMWQMPLVARSGAGGSAATPERLVNDAVSGIIPLKGLPLTVTALPFKTRAPGEPTTIVVLGIETPPAHQDRPAAPPARLEVLIAAFNRQVNQKAEERRTIEIDADLESTGRFNVPVSLSLKPGPYEIRAGAAADDGRVASVITYVDVPEFEKEALSLSGIVLGTTPSDPAAVTGSTADSLPFPPTTRRAFKATETVRAFVQVYEGGGESIVAVQVGVRIVDALGREVINLASPLGVERFGNGRAANFGAELPLSGLAPGEYLLTIAATDGKNTPRRDVRFTVQ